MSKAQALEIARNTSGIFREPEVFDHKLRLIEPGPVQLVDKDWPGTTISGEMVFERLVVPFPPSSNAYWRSMPCVRKGMRFPLTLATYGDMIRKIGAITFPSDEAKAYLRTMKEWAIQGAYSKHIDVPLGMDVIIHPRDRRVMDAHNRTKVLLDAFQSVGVYKDDSQVIDLRVRKGAIVKGGAAVVSMWVIKQWGII